MKNSTKKVLTAALAATIAISGSMSSFAATPQEITAKNPTSYTAGTQSVYGPNLNQDQLSAVAQAAADFKTNHVTDNMTNDQKIQTAHDFLKNTVSYIDWDQGEGANTAYGALVKGQAACSGYARAFKALCDAVDVSCYYIHADAAAGNPSHQWNIVEYNDGYYFVDVQTNDSSGFNAIYHSSTHPYTCDMSQLPAIGSKSGQNTAGTQATVTEGWKQDNTGWWYQNADGSYPMNAWREISGKQYYFGGNGYMLANTTTPDGYMVGSDGAWVQDIQSTNKVTNSSVPPYTYEFELSDFYENNHESAGLTYGVGMRYKCKVNGQYLKNTWIHLYSDTWHGYMFFGNDGKDLSIGESMDGYTISSSGFYEPLQREVQTPNSNDATKFTQVWESNAKLKYSIGSGDFRQHIGADGLEYSMVTTNASTFRFVSETSNIDPENHVIAMTAYTFSPESDRANQWSNNGTAIYLPFEYDKDYTFQLPDINLTGSELASYCKQHNIFISIDIIYEGKSNTRCFYIRFE